MRVQWLSGRVLNWRPRGRGFEPHRRHCVVSLSKNINPSLVLVQPRKTRPFITERLLMGRKESNQTKPLYSRLSLTQLCITQYYHLTRLDGPVPVFSPIYYCNSTTFISATAKSIKLITHYEKLVPLINFIVSYNA